MDFVQSLELLGSNVSTELPDLIELLNHPLRSLFMVKKHLQVSIQEAKDHHNTNYLGYLRQQYWVLLDIMAGIKTDIPLENYREALGMLVEHLHFLCSCHHCVLPEH